MSVAVELRSVADFSDAETGKLRAMKAAVYPDSTPETSANQAREWQSPQWGVFVTDESGNLLSYTGVVIRKALLDDEPAGIGGIGGVATHPSHRGMGYAPLGMGRALDFLLDREVEFALLVCRDELVDYYRGLGWRPFAGTVLNTQHGETEEFTFNRVMVGDLNRQAPMRGLIDLCGPAW